MRSAFRGFDRPDFWGLRVDDGRYRYDDGYLVRLDPDGRIGGYIPLLGGALAIGNLWPTYYQPVALPAYYESYYGLGPHNSYRYADNVIYQVDPETAAITSIARAAHRRRVRRRATDAGWATTSTTCPTRYRDAVLRHARRLVPLQRRLRVPGRSRDPADRRGDRAARVMRSRCRSIRWIAGALAGALLLGRLLGRKRWRR